jgi:GAF domain-containing protein
MIWQIRRLLDVSGCAFETVDWERRVILPTAWWFAGDEIRGAMGPLVGRPYEPERPGVTEAALESGEPLLMNDIETWPHAAALRARLEEQLDPKAARITWDWYRSSAFIVCPVRTASGRTLGVLAIAARRSDQPFGEETLRIMQAFADLGAFAVERAELLDREEHRVRDEVALAEATQVVTASLEPETVYRGIVEQAARLTGATKVLLARFEPATSELRVVSRLGIGEEVGAAHFRVGEGMIGRVAESGEPYVSRGTDESQWLSWVVEREHIRSFMHVPITLGPRLFGVLNVNHGDPDHFGDNHLEVLQAFGRSAAAAIANALDFQRERRVANALTRGFVWRPDPSPAGVQLGVVYEPAGEALGGGDVFGCWRLPSGGVALLVGDVMGKGIEVAALSAMVRFFVEARAWDCQRPADVLAQTHALLRGRLPHGGFVTAFLAYVERGGVSYANAGHGPALVVRADGGLSELAATGLPLGVAEEPSYHDADAALGPEDVIFLATDGLTDARREGEPFGATRLAQVLSDAAGLPPQELVEVLQRELEAWAPQVDDDVVILAARPEAPSSDLGVDTQSGPE